MNKGMRGLSVGRTIIAAAVLFASSSALGDGLIQLGDAQWRIENTSGQRTGAMGGMGWISTDGGATRHTIQDWWWFRTRGVDQREFALSNLVSESYNGNVASLLYEEPAGLQVLLTYILIPTPSGQALAWTDLRYRISSPQHEMTMFHYRDLDLSGTPGDDVAIARPYGRGPITHVTDSTTNFADLWTNTTRWPLVGRHMGAFPTLRDRLTDGDVDDFPGRMGFPVFGPGDVSTVYQFSVTPSAFPRWRYGANSMIGINVPDFRVPAPGVTSVFALSSGIFGLRRRR